MAQAGRSSKISCAVWSPSLYPHTTTGIRNWRLARRTWSAVRQTRQSAAPSSSRISLTRGHSCCFQKQRLLSPFAPPPRTYPLSQPMTSSPASHSGSGILLLEKYSGYLRFSYGLSIQDHVLVPLPTGYPGAIFLPLGLLTGDVLAGYVLPQGVHDELILLHTHQRLLQGTG